MEAVEIQTRAGEKHLTFGSVLGVSQARALYETLGQALAGDPAALVLDASRVQRVDTAALQILLAFRHAAHARRRPFRWHAVSAVMQQAVDLLGVNALLSGNDS